MFALEEKIIIFTNILSRNEVSYGDSFNGYIDMFGRNFDYVFLEKLNTEEDIEYWIRKLKSRVVMKEDEARVEDIIEDYFSCG